MGFKELFIKEEEQQQQVPVVAQEVAPTTQSVMPVVKAESKFVDRDIESKIWDMIVAKNLPGPDYLEFKNAAAGLAEIIPDKRMQMKGAFNVLKRSYPTFTKEIILSSIDNYINIVGEEKEKGKKECAEIRESKVGSKVSSINNMKQSASEILKQIDELKKQYESINTEIHKLELEVTEATNEINTKEQVFDNSVQAVIDTLNSDKREVTNLDI